jgi:homocysteine S-methyltransferase
MRDPISSMLREQPAIVLDGALATELERAGFDLRDPLWSARLLIDAPQAIRAVHASYLAAGADVATTASYQATYQGFARRGIDARQASKLLQLSVDLAREACDAFWSVESNRAGRAKPLIAASIGSYGAFLADGSEYRGDYGLGRATLFDFHIARMRTLAASGADLLAFETIPCLIEAQALVAALSSLEGVPAWLSFSCRDGERTNHGERIEDCVTALDGFEQLVAIGVNCTAPRFVGELVGRMRSATDKPIVAYPNSGERFVAATHSWADQRDSHDFGALAREWFDAGARVIGGCCRTTPDDVAAIARSMPRDLDRRVRARRGDAA